MSLRFTICDRCAGEPSLDCKPALIGDQKTIQSVGRRLVLCRCGGYVFAVMMFIAAAGLLVISVAMAMTITINHHHDGRRRRGHRSPRRRRGLASSW